MLWGKPRVILTGGLLLLYFPNEIYGCSRKRYYCDAILIRCQCDNDTIHTTRTLEAIHSDDINYFEDVFKK
jgi:hypothetical protein